ncbi:MAG: two-component sensor histidine kinase, partial [Glutamicibacter sp.]
RTTGGSGLGLSISMEDTRLHDGRLEAWGKPGVGSVFRLTLPRSEDLEIASSPLPLEPPVPESLATVILGDSFPLTGEVPKIGYTPLVLDPDLDADSPDDDVTNPNLGSNEQKKEGES